MVEVVGTSSTSFSDAVRAAVHRAGETLEDVMWFEVKEMRGRVSGLDIEEFQVKVEIGFRLHAANPEDRTGQAARRGPTKAARSMAAQKATAKKATARKGRAK